ncbi:MAG: hypothetical protein J0H75_10530, partial [Rhizobiales bacterium]|nr:hypothetical protein [Hyphomicrobiales bacterium]
MMRESYPNEYARIKRADRTCVVQAGDQSSLDPHEYQVKFTVESGTPETGRYRYYLHGCMSLEDAMAI